MRHPAFRHFLKFGAAAFLLAALFILPALPRAEGAIIYVTKTGSAVNNGTSWTTAYDEAAFINRLKDPGTVAGDEFRIAAGTYRPTTTLDRTQSFVLKSGVKLYGGFAGPGAADPDYRNLVTHETILTGDIDGDGTLAGNSYHVVVASGTDSAAHLDGFTVKMGSADGGGTNSDGGGLYSVNGNAMIRYCTFSENSAAIDGGGAYLTEGNVTLESCTFSQNTAANWGGGALLDTTNSLIANCTFSANRAQVDGGALDLETASPAIVNCTFYDNLADGSGGALYNSDSDPVIVNCTFFENTAADDGSGMYNGESNPAIMNSIFWDAGTSEISGGALTTGFISNSIVKGGFATGTNIITADPQLSALADNGGYTLTCALPSGSSAIDKGQPVGTAVSGSVNVPATDQRGVDRPQGSGVDIGAYEREVSPTPGGGSGGGCQSTIPVGAAWLMIPLALLLLRRRDQPAKQPFS